MEASDAFAQEIEGDDPFAEDFGEPLDPQAPDPAGAQGSELPVVDREGNPVQTDQNGTVRNEIDPATGEAAPLPPEGAQAPQEAAQAPQADPTTPSGGRPDPTPSSSTPSSAEPTGDGGAAATAAASEQPAPVAAESQASTPEHDAGSEDGEDAPEPSETKDKSNRTTKRRYLIYKVDGPDKLTQVVWYEDTKGNIVERGKGKRQKVCLARGTDDALKFGYLAAGSPKGGIKLVAVAKLHFQPREVKPLPPEPSKQRLAIN